MTSQKRRIRMGTDETPREYVSSRVQQSLDVSFTYNKIFLNKIKMKKNKVALICTTKFLPRGMKCRVCGCADVFITFNPFILFLFLRDAFSFNLSTQANVFGVRLYK